MTCALCKSTTTDTRRISGWDFCAVCITDDPREHLQTHHGIASEWDTRMGRFQAGLGVPGLSADFSMRLVPKRWPHLFTSYIWPDVDIGDADFDQRIYAQTSNEEELRSKLASEGSRSALLSFLSSVRDNELMGNKVALNGPTLTIGVRPQGTFDDDRIQELKLEAAALALHLKAS